MWTVQIAGEPRRLSDASVRHQLRSGDLTGLELARREGDEAWMPLHEHSVFAEEVPHLGSTAAAARNRLAGGLYWNGVAYLATVGALAGLGLWGLLPWVAGIWGLLMVWHLATALPVLWRARSVDTAQASLDAEGSEDPFVDQVEAALRGLGDPADAAEVVAAAQILSLRRRALQDLGSERVMHEAEQIAAGSSEPKGSGEARREALDERLRLCRLAAREAERLQARQRTLLHQLQGIRLASFQAQGEEPGGPSFLREQLGDLTAQLITAAEVSERLLDASRVPSRGGEASS